VLTSPDEGFEQNIAKTVKGLSFMRKLRIR
jgi:hypothetical protein